MEVHNAENQSSGAVSRYLQKDTYLEVTDEVQAVFLADKRAEARYLRQMYNYKAHYSLTATMALRSAIVQHPPTPEEILRTSSSAIASTLR